MRWDLSDLFAGADDPKITETLDRAKIDAEAFAGRYRGKIDVDGGPSAALLLQAVQEIEGIHERAGAASPPTRTSCTTPTHATRPPATSSRRSSSA